MMKVLFLMLTVFSIISGGNFKLTINTFEENSAIFVDGKLVGKGSVIYNVSNGTYVITVKENIKEWNPRTITDTVIISDNDISKTYSFNKQMYIGSSRSFEILYEDPYFRPIIRGEGRFVLPGPGFIDADVKKLETWKPGFISRALKIEELDYVNYIELEKMEEFRKERFTETPWFKVLLGSAVVLGTTAAYFKLKADDSYDRYQDTRDESLKDDTDRYDVYSGVAFGLLQINFGYLIYEFVTE